MDLNHCRFDAVDLWVCHGSPPMGSELMVGFGIASWRAETGDSVSSLLDCGPVVKSAGGHGVAAYGPRMYALLGVFYGCQEAWQQIRRRPLPRAR